MKSPFSLVNLIPFALVSLAVLAPQSAQAEWGLGVGYNNPIGTRLGVNALYLARPFAIEIGISSLDLAGGDKKASTGLAGDLDLKAILGSKGDFAPYIEGGFLMGAGARAGKGSGFSIGFDNPFVGVGLFVEGTRVYAFGGAGYLLSTKVFYPVLSVGIKL